MAASSSSSSATPVPAVMLAPVTQPTFLPLALAVPSRLEISDGDLQAVLQTQDFQRLADICQAFELQLEPHPNPGVVEEIRALHLLALLRLGQVENARFLWKRLPKQLKEAPQLVALWKIGQALIKKDTVGFYRSAMEHQWGARIAPFVQALIENTREHMQTFISGAYSSISVGDCSLMLGLPQDQTVAYTTQKLHWAFDVDKGFLHPTQPAAQATRDLGRAQLRQLTSYAVNLES